MAVVVKFDPKLVNMLSFFGKFQAENKIKTGAKFFRLNSFYFCRINQKKNFFL